MRKRIWLLIVLLVFLAACDQVETPSASPSGAQNDAILSLPTRTLGPIVSFTPRFTATPIPSATLTPSDTPTPTLTSIPATATPTLTLTPTPTVQGVIRSTENVNLRSGPSLDYPVVVSVPPGTPLGVLGMQADTQNREWYKVAYDDDGEMRYLWIYSNLVETNFEEVVGLAATPPPPPNTTVTPRPTLEPDRVDILAYCQQKNIIPETPTTNDNVYIWWSWYVSLPGYMEEHLKDAHYEVRLDGKLLENWPQYATDMREESGNWLVYWYYPVGKLTAGQHKIDFKLTWDETITDGYKQFGPGTPNESDQGNCTFNVVGP